MSLNKRLTYYFFGLSIGCLITYFIVNQKNTEFNYLPNKRVISDFKKKIWEFDNSFINYDTINITNNSINGLPYKLIHSKYFKKYMIKKKEMPKKFYKL